MLTLAFLLASIFSMGIGALGLLALHNQGSSLLIRRWSEFTSWIALGFGVIFSALVWLGYRQTEEGNPWLVIGPLQGVLVPYILLMGVLIKRFSYNYLQSDEAYPVFFLRIKALIFSLLLFVVANHIALLWFAWFLSGSILCQLIKHTKTSAATNAGTLSQKVFTLGDITLAIGLFALAINFSSPSIQQWQGPIVGAWGGICLVLIVIGAMTKTALYPFHTWLPHTLTAPTPVSAIMHAGFVNSGAILLAKISPLIIQHSWLMAAIVVIGLLSTLWGSMAMMVQPDVKRYLTFSTIGQMGFMMMACGLGAFHLAIGHLMVHGLFKSRLFLASGSVIQYRQTIRNAASRLERQPITRPILLLLALIMLMCASILIIHFVEPEFISQIYHLPTLFIVAFGLSVLFTQLALMKVQSSNVFGIGIALIFSLAMILAYLCYEKAMTTLLPDYNLTPLMQDYFVTEWLAMAFLLAGIVTLIIQSKLVRLPKKLADWGYVQLLMAAKNRPYGISTFTHRLGSL